MEPLAPTRIVILDITIAPLGTLASYARCFVFVARVEGLAGPGGFAIPTAGREVAPLDAIAFVEAHVHSLQLPLGQTARARHGRHRTSRSAYRTTLMPGRRHMDTWPVPQCARVYFAIAMIISRLSLLIS